MTDSAIAPTTAHGTLGQLRYLDPAVQPSLFRNGRVLTRRDPDGSDAGTEGVVTEPCEVTVQDGRQHARTPLCTLAKNGFELLSRPFADPTLDFFNHEEVVSRYYDDCARLVAEFTGARAFAFDHNVRSAQGKKSGHRIKGGQQVQGPAQMVHGDYTLTSAPQRLRDLTRPPGGNDTLRGALGEHASLISPSLADAALAPGGRFAIINVWRNIAAEPVATYPLALCDGQTVLPEDLVVFEIHYQDRIGENYFARPSARHGWYYYPAMTRDEALLIKQWDSAGALARSGGSQGDATDTNAPCTFSFHTAFDDVQTPPDAPDRLSIEVRCMVIYA